MTASDLDRQTSAPDGSDPGLASRLFNGGLGEHRVGHIAAAAESYRRALAVDPTLGDAIHMLGATHLQDGRPDEALTLLLRTRAVQARSDMLARNLEACLHQLRIAATADLEEGRFVEGAGRLLRVFDETGDASVRSTLEQVQPQLLDAGFRAVAVRSYARALDAVGPVLRLDPGNLTGNLVVGFCKSNRRHYGEMEEAARRLRHVLTLDPANPLAWRSLGMIGTELYHIREAFRCLYRYACIDEEAFRVIPDLAGAFYLLRDVSYFRFCELYSTSRGAAPMQFSVTDAQGRQDVYTPEAWDGRPRPDKTLIVSATNAIGDIIMFSRYILVAATMFRTVYVKTHRYMEKLLRSLVQPGNILVNPPGFPALPDYRAEVSTMPLLLSPDFPDSVPTPGAYLAVDPARLEHWRHLRDPGRVTVGIAWQSNGPERCIPFGFLEGLIAAHPDVRFVVLHHKLDDPADTVRVERAMRRFGDRLLWPRDADQPEGLYDTAAITANMDLVITTDTGMLHIAGALGRQFWLALQTPGHWQWVKEETSMPWYATGRLFRQKTYGYWQDVFAEIDTALGSFTEKKLAG